MKITKEDIAEYQEKLKDFSAEEIIAWAAEFFGPDNVALASSISAEDQVLTEMIARASERMQIFTLDTGRLPSQTYDVIAGTISKYGMDIEMLFPERADVEKMTSEFGPNLFYDSIESRKLCCKVRKIEPLKRKLSNLKAWITGLRREQAVTRSDMEVLEWDEAFSLVKINPLFGWTEKNIWKYIKDNDVPYNKLHDAGYRSIGCAPCTRAVKESDDVRAGRWWWEAPEQKECGLHIKNGKVIRGRK